MRAPFNGPLGAMVGCINICKETDNVKDEPVLTLFEQVYQKNLLRLLVISSMKKAMVEVISELKSVSGHKIFQ